MAEDDVADTQVEEENITPDEEGEEDSKEALKKVIKVSVTDAGTLRKGLTVTVPRDSLDSELDKDYEELISDAIVPGFRRGRAPRRLVEKRFGSEVGEQVQTRLVTNAYMAAIEKEDLKVLGDPMVWVMVKDKKATGEEEAQEKEQLLDLASALRHMKLPDEGELNFRCEVEVKPEFELPKLEGVKIEKPDVKITDKDVSVQIDRMREMRGHFKPVLDGKVEADDLLVCDMKMSVGGKEIRTEENVSVAARPQQIEGAALEDLGKALVGAKLGDTQKVEGELPEDYEVEDVRGKKAEFEFTINEIKRLELPPLDEAFLASLGFEGKDAEKEYRAWIRDRMEGRLDLEIRSGMRNQVRQYLLKSTKLDLPEGISSRQTERTVLRQMIELQRRGVPVSEVEKRADELRTSAREQAVTELKLHFILEEIAEKLDISVSEEEINGQIAAMAQAHNQRFDRVRDQLAKNNGIESLYLEIRDEKCVDKILEDARITEAKVTPRSGKKAAGDKAKKDTTKPAKDERAGAKEKTKTRPKRKPPAK